MASINGSQFAFSAAQTVNLVQTSDGTNLPPPIPGQFNLEFVTSPVGNNFPIPAGYQGVALLNDAATLTMLHGNYEVTDLASGGGDTVIGGDGFDTINVLVGNDLVTLGSGNTTIFGAAGDTIAASGGAALVNFNAGFAPITVTSAGGTVVVRSGAGDTLTGGSAAAVFIGAPFDNITAGSAADTLNAVANNETFTLGSGDDSVNVYGSNDTVRPVSGHDTINLISGGSVGNNAFDLSFNIAGVGDLTGNGLDGIVWQRASDGLVEAQFLNGNNVVGGGPIATVFDSTYRVVAVGDFSGDGKSDLVYRRISDGLTQIQFLNGNTAAGGGVIANNVFGNDFNVVGVGDFNGDGKSDLVWQRPSDGVVEIQFLNGNTAIGGGQIVNNAFGADFKVVGVGDFNGDGKSDLVWQRPSDGVVEIQFLNGITAIGGGQIVNNAFGADFKVVGVGDFNGDGKSDLVWQRPSDGLIEVQFLDGLRAIGGSTVGTNPFGVNGTVIGVGDFTGGGKKDLIIRNQANGAVAIQPLSGSTAIGGHTTIADGLGSFHDTVVGFVAGSDTIKLTAGETSQSVLATTQLVNGGQDTQITLSGGSTIVFKGITHIDTSFFS